MIAIADGQATNKVAADWARKSANRKACRYAFLDTGATSRAALEEDKQDLNNTGKMSDIINNLTVCLSLPLSV
jgi:hypothetical protein